MSLSVDRLSLSSEQYTRWCAETPSLPLYVQPWWLLATSGCEELPVLATRVAKEDAPTLVWPLFMPTRRHLIVPPYCQFTGPLSDRLGAVGEEPFDRDRYIAHLAAMEALGEALPSSLRYIEAHLPLDYWDWLPSETPAGVWRSSVASSIGMWRPSVSAPLLCERSSLSRLPARIHWTSLTIRYAIAR